MASLLREERYEKNRDEMSRINRTFRFVMFMGFGIAVLLWVVLYVVYLIKALALAAGGSMYAGETILRAVLGEEYSGEAPVASNFPFFWMFYLAAVAGLTFLSSAMRIRKANFFLAAAYLCTLANGIYCLAAGKEGLVLSLGMIVGGGFGLWLSDITFRLYKSLEVLSFEEGFPDFIDIIDEPHAIANTNGLYYKKYVYMSRQAKEKKKLLLAQMGNADKDEAIKTPEKPKDFFRDAPSVTQDKSDEMPGISVDLNEPIDEILSKPIKIQ